MGSRCSRGLMEGLMEQMQPNRELLGDNVFRAMKIDQIDLDHAKKFLWIDNTALKNWAIK